MRRAGDTVLSGERAFALHDTYGFPIDLTLEMAQEQGLLVDEVGFRELMGQQRDRAKADARAKKGRHVDATAYRQVADSIGQPVEFTGYREVVSEGSVRGLVAAGGVVDSAREGDEVELVLDRTPFYAEGGGQLADQGVIELENGARVEVRDVQTPVTGLVVHTVKVLSGEVTPGLGAHSEVDIERRKSISRAHTATHMVHKAFREALGDTATQAGSENAPGRFRFDFSATGAVPVSVMEDVEARVNDLVLADLGVHAEIMSQDEAVRSGAMALFGEKYGDEVRVVSVGDWARELCGGTHAGRSGQLGVIKLLGESSIGSGVRRVEALVGADAYKFLAREHVLVAQLSEALKARPEELPERVNDIVERLRAAEKALEQTRIAQLLSEGAQLAADAVDVNGVRLISLRIDGADGGRRAHDGAQPPQPAQPGAARRRRADRGQGRQGRGRGRDQRPGPRPRRQGERPAGRGDAARRRAWRRQGRRRPGRRLRRQPRRRGAGRGDRRGRERHRGLRRCGPAYASASTRVTPGSGSPAATPPASWRPRSRPYGGAAATSPGSPGSRARPRRSRSWSGCRARCRGSEGPAAARVREFAGALAARVTPVPVRLQDERLTTVSAEAMLRDRGKKGASRRAVVDQAAAVLILQHALDTERETGRPPGEIVTGDS